MTAVLLCGSLPVVGEFQYQFLNSGVYRFRIAPDPLSLERWSDSARSFAEIPLQPRAARDELARAAPRRLTTCGVLWDRGSRAGARAARDLGSS